MEFSTNILGVMSMTNDCTGDKIYSKVGLSIVHQKFKTVWKIIEKFLPLDTYCAYLFEY